MTATSKMRPKDGGSHHDEGPGSDTAAQPSTGVQPTDPRTSQAQGKHDEDQHAELQKNVSGPDPQAQHNPASTGGLHATGSYTGDPKKAGEEKK